MLRFLYRLHTIINGNKLGGGKWVPLPSLIQKYLKKLPGSIQLHKIAQIMAGTKLVQAADLSEIAPNEYGCAEAQSRIINIVLPDFKVVTSTIELGRSLARDYRFKELVNGEIPVPGDIIINITGTGNGLIRNGHTGTVTYVGKVIRVYSNNSENGRWSYHWDYDAWRRYYQIRGGMKTHIYRLTN